MNSEFNRKIEWAITKGICLSNIVLESDYEPILKHVKGPVSSLDLEQTYDTLTDNIVVKIDDNYIECTMYLRNYMCNELPHLAVMCSILSTLKLKNFVVCYDLIKFKKYVYFYFENIYGVLYNDVFSSFSYAKNLSILFRLCYIMYRANTSLKFNHNSLDPLHIIIVSEEASAQLIETHEIDSQDFYVPTFGVYPKIIDYNLSTLDYCNKHISPIDTSPHFDDIFCIKQMFSNILKYECNVKTYMDIFYLPIFDEFILI